jgi:hypothetical protein
LLYVDDDLDPVAELGAARVAVPARQIEVY